MLGIRRLLAVAMGLGLALLIAGGALAAEKKAPPLKGTVKVTKADDGKVTVTLTVKVKDQETVYTLAGDKVKELEGMDGKMVIVTGQVEEKDGAKTLTVESFKEPPAKGGKKAVEKAVEKPAEAPETN